MKKKITTLTVLLFVAAVLRFIIKAEGLDQGLPPKKPDPTWITRDSKFSPEFRFFMVQYSKLLSDFATNLRISFYADISDDFRQDGQTLYVTPDPKWPEGSFPLAVIHKLWGNAHGGNTDVAVCVLDADGDIVGGKGSMFSRATLAGEASTTAPAGIDRRDPKD